MGYALHLKIALFLPFPAEGSQLLGFTCYAGIKNKKRTKALRLYDGTNTPVVIKSRRSTHP